MLYPFGWVGTYNQLPTPFLQIERDVSPEKLWSKHEKIMNNNIL